MKQSIRNIYEALGLCLSQYSFISLVFKFKNVKIAVLSLKYTSTDMGNNRARVERKTFLERTWQKEQIRSMHKLLCES